MLNELQAAYHKAVIFNFATAEALTRYLMARGAPPHRAWQMARIVAGWRAAGYVPMWRMRHPHIAFGQPHGLSLGGRREC